MADEDLSCLSAGTNPRLIPARSKMIIAISDMLRAEGVLYTMPPMSKINAPTHNTSVDDGGGGAVCLVLNSAINTHSKHAYEYGARCVVMATI